RGNEHVEKTRGVRRMCAQRVLQRPRDRPKRRLVQYDVDAGACPPGRGDIGNVGFDPRMPSPRIVANGITDGIEIFAVTRRKIVEADNLLVQAKQCLEQMRSDEARAARYQP